MARYLACKFEKSTFSALVKESFDIDFLNVFTKEQIDYFFRYLKDLKANSIVLEFDYLDKDYLEDYARYYVKCFNNHGHKTARLHFFSNDVYHQEIDSALKNDPSSIKLVQENYLGFMVIKPIQKTFIGKTCLKLYDKFQNGKTSSRNCLKRSYKVNLFGISLSVESVAFQEQDKVVSACATTAIWSSLHAMKCCPIRDIPSCSEITSNAMNHIVESANLFPNKELSNKQILRALDCQKLRNHVFNIEKYDSDKFLKTIQHHIDSGLPLILGIDVYRKNSKNVYEKLAGHAVTILGYKKDPLPAIYIHDDRLGPFARAIIKPLAEELEPSLSKENNQFCLVLQKKDHSNGQWQEPHELLIPSTLICSTHKKVRLPSDFSDNTCELIVDHFKEHIVPLMQVLNDSEHDEISDNEDHDDVDINGLINELEYNISLREISEIKNEIILNDDYKNSRFKSELESKKLSFLTRSYAKTHWVAQFKTKNKKLFKILFDATDIPQGNAVAGIYADSIDGYIFLTFFLENIKKLESLGLRRESRDRDFLNSFLKTLKYNEHGDRSFYLDTHFGELRAPHYIKAEQELYFDDIKDNETKKIFHEAQQQSLSEIFSSQLACEKDKYLIWAIDHEGAVIIGKEDKGEGGHPCITGFKPARIAGELHYNNKIWFVNSKSGRYSGHYDNVSCLLNNAVELFNSLFYKGTEQFQADENYI